MPLKYYHSKLNYHLNVFSYLVVCSTAYNQSLLLQADIFYSDCKPTSVRK